MKTGMIIPAVAIFSFLLFVWRSRRTRAVNFLLAAAEGFSGSSVITAVFVFVTNMTTQGSRNASPGLMKSLAVAFMIVFLGFVLRMIFNRLGELKSTLDSKAKMDLSRVATKILNDDGDYFQAIVVPSKTATWRDYARTSQLFPRSKPNHIRIPSAWK